jgi:hypothetical protein
MYVIGMGRACLQLCDEGCELLKVQTGGAVFVCVGEGAEDALLDLRGEEG